MARPLGLHMSNIHPAKNSPRDYVEIGAAFLIIVAILLVLGQLDLLPKQFGVSETMSYGLVFVIGLVASVSSCIAVTGGLLVAVAAKYNEASTTLTPVQRMRPHIYFNAGASLLHAARRSDRRAGSALTLSPEINGVLTLRRERGDDPARAPDAQADCPAHALSADHAEIVQPLHS